MKFEQKPDNNKAGFNEEERVIRLANETAAFEEAGIPPKEAVLMAEEKVREQEEQLKTNPDHYDLGEIDENLAA